MSYVCIGNGLYVRAGSERRKPIMRRNPEPQPKPSIGSFATGPSVYNWAHKVGAGECCVLRRIGFRYQRMTIRPIDGHYEGRWL